MIFKHFLPLLLLCIFLFSSCSSHVVIQDTECDNSIVWANHLEEADFVLEKNLWTPLGFFHPTRLEIATILKENQMSCAQVKTLSVVVKSSWPDLLKSLVPFMGSKSVFLYGTL